MQQILLNGITIDELAARVGTLIIDAIKQKDATATPNAEEGYISRKEVAKLLKISLPTLNQRTKSGELKSYKIGARVLYKRSEIDEQLSKAYHNKYKKP